MERLVDQLPERLISRDIENYRTGVVGSGPIASAPPAGNYPAGAMWYAPPIYKSEVNLSEPWTLRTSAADNSWASVCWSPELRIFVAVANSGTGNRVMTNWFKQWVLV